ncbi:hypothetical protein CRUP_009706 [Coryphaenoides rupestris]|nr:hypothetical protein CRUP_009706 [Coryphaenoides rupestris]
METPQWEPQRLMLLSEMAAMRSWSNARVKKVAKNDPAFLSTIHAAYLQSLSKDYSNMTL